MKKILILGVAVLVTGLAGCSKFLEEHSQNASYVESPADLEELLYGSALMKSGEMGNYLHLLADESKELYYSTSGMSINNNATLMSAAGMFRWHRDPFTNYTASAPSNIIVHEWDKFYEIIAVANSIIENAKEFDGSDRQVAYVTGSAHFLRALNYFQLVNVYGEPYSKSDPEMGLGVPYKGSSKVDQGKQVRQSTGYIYDRIVEDLVEAARLFEISGNYGQSPFKVSADAVRALQSRVYLYMERYSDAIAAANGVENLNLYDLASVYPVGQGEVFLNKSNSEIIFAQGRNNTGQAEGIERLMSSTGSSDAIYDGSFDIIIGTSAYCVDDELFGLFTTDDVRLSAFFTLSYNIGAPMARKFRPLLDAMVNETDPLDGSELGPNIVQPEFSECGVLRASEVILNKAEAQALAGDAGALQTITEFVNTRYTNPPAIPAGGDALIEFIRNERRKELCFEGHRWFDLRRYAVNTVHPQTISITHQYHATESNTTSVRGSYTLESYSATTKGQWVLPIPPGEIDFNWPEITNLDRTIGVTLDQY